MCAFSSKNKCLIHNDDDGQPTATNCACHHLVSCIIMLLDIIPIIEKLMKKVKTIYTMYPTMDITVNGGISKSIDMAAAVACVNLIILGSSVQGSRYGRCYFN